MGRGQATYRPGRSFFVDVRSVARQSELIRAHWSEILRVVASIRTGTVTASLIMRQLRFAPALVGSSVHREGADSCAVRSKSRQLRVPDLNLLDTVKRSEMGRKITREKGYYHVLIRGSRNEAVCGNPCGEVLRSIALQRFGLAHREQ